jgi:hypothetical protein
MKMSKESIQKCRDLVTKHAPEILSVGGIKVMMFDMIWGTKAAKLRLEGYSDEEIIKILLKEKS